MRSFILNLLLLVLAYKLLMLGIAGSVPVSVVFISMGALLISVWFKLEKIGIL